MQAFFIRRWAVVVAAAAAALALSGCGGSGEAPAGVKLLSSVDSRVQPASAVQDVARVKARSAASAPPAAVVALGEMVLEKSDAPATVGPQLVGQGRVVEATRTSAATQAKWQWKATPAGGLVAAISFRAAGAYGVRLGVLVGQLPGSAVVRVYTQAVPGQAFEISGHEILQLIERNQAAGDRSDAARTWWTPDTGEDEATLEVELPRGIAAKALDISVPQLSHIFVNLAVPTEQELQAQQGTKDIGDSDACNLDSTCHTDGASERNAVARMVFVKDAKSYLCTGTLLNDGGSTGTPYFLSANHCISQQTVASTLRTDWFFRSSSCSSGALQSTSSRKVGGAKLLYASADSDTALLLLNDTPPAGAVFAGWDASTVALGAPAIGLHHPSGDLLKLSRGSVAGQSSCNSTSETTFSCTGSSGNYYRVNWSDGTTEGGSSGSALFRSGRVVGTLYGGSAVCTNKSSADFYGRFDVAYNAALKNWLGSAVAGRTAIYRFFNVKTGAHFFTASAAERDFVISTYPQFSYENVAFYAYAQPATGQSTVYRFFNTSNGAHFYTINQAESDYVRANYPVFKYEGPIWYAQAGAGSGATPIYRFYKPSTGTHFYTISLAERDFVIANYKDFQYEDVAYYAWTSH